MTISSSVFYTTQTRFALTASLLAGLAIPISTAGQNIGAALLLLAALTTPQLWSQLKVSIRHPFAQIGLALGIALIIGTFWTSASAYEAWRFVLKMRAYYLIPLFLIILSLPRLRNALLLAFAAGTLLSVVLSCISAWLNFPIFQGIPGDWFIFRSHTYHNYFAALLSIALLSGLLANKFIGIWKWLAIICVVILSYDILFLVAGRTAQILYLLMIPIVLLLWNWRWGLLISIIMLVFATFILPKYSPAVQHGINNAESDLIARTQGKSDTSIGLRLGWYTNSLKLILDKPLFGHGTGSIGNEYASAYGNSMSNPHNDYIWLSVELGILGAALLISLLLAAAWQGRHLDSAWKWTLYAMLAAMGIATLANSFFTDNITGLAFVLLTSALLNGPKKDEQTS
jgi:O-antigen ligase